MGVLGLWYGCAMGVLGLWYRCATWVYWGCSVSSMGARWVYWGCGMGARWVYSCVTGHTGDSVAVRGANSIQ
eukprot:3657912-Pyramimonas_sp.AAC.1